MTADKTDKADKDKIRIYEPVDRHDGIPDCRSTRPIWLLVLLAAVFVAWAAALVWIKASA